MSEIIYECICKQDYQNAGSIEAGLVLNAPAGHVEDSIYLGFLGRPNAEENVRILLRRDEVASVIWALGGALYSLDMAKWEETQRERG